MKQIKVCIFDLDGTLLDTLSGIMYYINSVFDEEKIPHITLEQTREFVGDGMRNLIVRACAASGVTDLERVERVMLKYKNAYDSDPYKLVSVYDGISELLDSLTARGIKLAVLSNKPDFATRMMVEHFFGKKFDAVRGNVDGVALKPSPDGALLILSELGCSPDECAFIGDGETDVETAIKLGAERSVSVLWGFRTREQLEPYGAKIFVNSSLEILEYID